MNENILKARLIKLQEKLGEKGIDAILINNPINRAYITGFIGTAGYALVTHDKAFLLTDFRYTQQAGEQAPCFEVRQFESKPFKYLNELLLNNNIENLGFEDHTITYSQYQDFQKEFTIKKFVPAQDILIELRKVKDATEIENMRQAASIADKAFSHILQFIKVGMTELEIALELEFFMKAHGAQALSFESIVASGARSALPHGQPTQKIVESGDLLTLDFGCVYEGYCSDMTRTIGLGSLTDKQKEIYNIVLEAQMSALDHLQAGKTGKEIDAVARDLINSHGYGKNFGHGLGHGVGLEIHESPRLSLQGDDILQAGMVATVEPGIYIEGFGGVRIEDMVVVTDNGMENLTFSPKDLIII